MIVRGIWHSAFAVALAGSFVQVEAQAQAPGAKPATTTTPAAKPAAPAGQGGSAAAVESKSGPDVTTESYGDWIMKCQAKATPKQCEVSQTIVVQGQQAPIALIAVGREKSADPFHLVVQLPNNVSLQGGVKALLHGGEVAGELHFTRCVPVGCFADMTLNDAVLAKLKAQAEPGELKFKDGLEREISLPLSLHGFGPAVEALTKS
jgi:invasion protein IalB